MTARRRGTPSSWRRTILHASLGVLAPTLGLWPRPLSLALSLAGVALTWVVFPLTRLERALRREGEGFLCGLRTYPLAVLLLVLFLAPAGAAAAFAVMAFGDATAAWVGRNVPAPAVFGHRKATWSGSGAYLASGTLAGWLAGLGAARLDAWVGWAHAGPAPEVWGVAVAALAATLSDLLPIYPDDNLPAALAAGGVLLALGSGV